MQDAPGRFCAIQAVWHHRTAQQSAQGSRQSTMTRITKFNSKIHEVFFHAVLMNMNKYANKKYFLESTRFIGVW